MIRFVGYCWISTWPRSGISETAGCRREVVIVKRMGRDRRRDRKGREGENLNNRK